MTDFGNFWTFSEGAAGAKNHNCVLWSRGNLLIRRTVDGRFLSAPQARKIQNCVLWTSEEIYCEPLTSAADSKNMWSTAVSGKHPDFQTFLDKTELLSSAVNAEKRKLDWWILESLEKMSGINLTKTPILDRLPENTLFVFKITKNRKLSSWIRKILSLTTNDCSIKEKQTALKMYVNLSSQRK